jgi:hypothetical protein
MIVFDKADKAGAADPQRQSSADVIQAGGMIESPIPAEVDVAWLRRHSK